MDEMPCAYVMATIKKGHMDAYEYYSIYYKNQTYIATYKVTIKTVGNPDEREIPKEMEKMEVEAPIEKRTARRPKKTRLLSCGEFRKHNMKCAKCG